jgi:NAD(P)-dependent dehydrogenase (short-subunit alcohol dehydrogenase family)
MAYFDLKGQNAVVTGASSGLGVQFAKALAGQGANVALLARRQEKLQAVKSEIEAMGVQVLAIQADVTNEDSIKSAITQIEQAWGQIHVLVNNAGVSALGGAEDMPEADWDKVLDTNLKGVWLVAKHVGKHMIAKKYGRVINIASMFGVVGNTFFPASAYHASKGGVVNLTKALAAEWAKHDITVNAIGPGFFESEMTEAAIAAQTFQNYVKNVCPMQRIGKPGELDPALIFLAAPESSYVTGQTVCVDGGWTAV